MTTSVPLRSRAPLSRARAHVVAILADRFLTWNAGRIYLKNLLAAAASVPERSRLVVITRHEFGSDDALGSADEIVTYDEGAVLLRVRRRISAYRGLGEPLPSGALRRIRPAAVFGNGLSSQITSAAVVANLLDYQERHYPHLCTPEKLARRDREEARIAHTAHGILFNSSWSLHDFASRHPTCRSVKAVVPLHSGVSPEELSLEPRAVAEKYRLPERFFVVPSQLWAHKNHRQLLDAMTLLKARNINITAVLTGQPFDPRQPMFVSELLRTICERDLHDRVILLGQIERSELIALMRQALGIVQPSLHEGGGLPAEEARVLGKPIVLADLPLQREADIPFATYFAPEDTGSLASAIDAALGNVGAGVDDPAERRALAAAETRLHGIGRAFCDLVRRSVEASRGIRPAPEPDAGPGVAERGVGGHL